MIQRKLLLIILTVGIAGCATKRKYVKPLQGPTSIPIESAANVRIGEVVKAYPINRYIDPADRKVMHERHVVYRVEEDAAWRLTSNAQQQILVGNTFSASQMQSQALRNQEVPGVVTRQKALSERMTGLQRSALENALLAQRENSELRNEVENIRQEVQKLASEKGRSQVIGNETLSQQSNKQVQYEPLEEPKTENKTYQGAPMSRDQVLIHEDGSLKEL